MQKLKNWIIKLNDENQSDNIIISFKTHRKAVGWIATLLGPTLVIGTMLFGTCNQLQPSISHYYFTSMGDVFVGVLCAVALFLFSYKGYSVLDNHLANIAGFGALGTALFPTSYLGDCKGITCQTVRESVFSFLQINGSECDKTSSWLSSETWHYVSAGSLFVCLVLFCILFTFSNKPKAEITDEKHNRNKVFVICALVISICIISILLAHQVFKVPDASTITFWLELAALVAFGISWLTKGELIFGDKNKQTSK